MSDRVKILLVDDQPAKLLSYETVLRELDEDLIQASSGHEALQLLLKHEVAVILIDVLMPEIDGFQLAEMIRDHPRFKKTGIIFVSAVLLSDADRLRGYDLGAVDYVPVPVIPELLRAKVRVFVELYRKTQQLETLNQELESRVLHRTAELAAANARLAMAVEVAQLETWEWYCETDTVTCTESYIRLLGRDPRRTAWSVNEMLAWVHPEDRSPTEAALRRSHETGKAFHQVFRNVRSDGSIVWCDARAHLEPAANGQPTRMVGVVMDISQQKLAAERQEIMMQELYHRVKNSLSTVQAIANLSRRTAVDIDSFSKAFDSRLVSLSKTHTLLVNHKWNRIGLRDILMSELDAFDDVSEQRIELNGPPVDLPSETAVSLGLAVHELTTNTAKYGALSVPGGRLIVTWSLANQDYHNASRILHLLWRERGGPPVCEPQREGFGTALLRGLFNEHNGSSANMHFDPAGLDIQLTMAWHPL